MEAYGHRGALSPLNGHVPRRALLLHTPPRSMETALTPGGQQTHTPASEAVAGHLRDASTQYMDAVFSRETMPAVDRLGDGRERAVVTFFQWETRLGSPSNTDALAAHSRWEGDLPAGRRRHPARTCRRPRAPGEVACASAHTKPKCADLRLQTNELMTPLQDRRQYRTNAPSLWGVAGAPISATVRNTSRPSPPHPPTDVLSRATVRLHRIGDDGGYRQGILLPPSTSNRPSCGVTAPYPLAGHLRSAPSPGGQRRTAPPLTASAVCHTEEPKASCPRVPADPSSVGPPPSVPYPT